MEATTDNIVSPATAAIPAVIPAKKQQLVSQFPALPCTVPRFTIGRDGAVGRGPGRFLAGPQEVLNWVIANHSHEPVTVTLVDFLRRNAVDPTVKTRADAWFEWLRTNSITLAHGQTGSIYAKIALPPFDGIDSIEYTIQVRGTTFAIDYDPDGEIKP